MDAIERARSMQAVAADPGRSVVLEAAAGAGKTRVLVDRFLRLCLGGGGADLDPRAILAITFTRKATIEIQARLQEQARRLVALPADARRLELQKLLGRSSQPAELARAAWFHEVLLDDPVGLGIETLHAFCQRILGRFAAEAGLDPRFAVLEDRAEDDARAEALDRLELELAADPAAASAQAGLSDSPLGARGKLAELFQQRVYLQRWLDRVCPPAGPAAAALGRQLSPCLDALLDDLRSALFQGTPLAGAAAPTAGLLAPALSEALRRFLDPGLAMVAAADAGADLTAGLQKQLDGWVRDARLAITRLDADPAAAPAVIGALTGSLLTKDGGLRSVNGRKDTKSERQDAFAVAAAPVLQILQQAGLLDLFAHNTVLLRHGLRALDLYAEVKRRDRVVDFQDLEYLALRLLTDEHSGPQVHYRLDAHLAHLLLDEFQDTNRNQWELLEPLLLEVLAGGEPPRTALIVGDVKQSIYGFRGAEPDVFGEARDLVQRQAGEGAVQVLPTNFRSLPAIVTAVGRLCRREPLAGYLGDAAAGAAQDIARSAAQGEVVCVRPFARQGDQSGHERAAAATVALIAELLVGAVQTWDWNPQTRQDVPRPLRHEDILILTRTKTHLAVYETALRRAGIPFAPAGRGLLARCREVQDILALLRWLSFPVDDTAGAVVLRSPLCRLPEERVQLLLQARLPGQDRSHRRSLHEVLQAAANSAAGGPLDPHEKATVALLLDWVRLAGLMPLHDLLRRLYREGEVLERFEIAHGEQARFNLLRLLDLALSAEARGGSLRDFVEELEQAARLGGQEEGAQPAEAGSGRVRVMTVHGAKGLEAPVVILADAAAPLREATPSLLLAPAAHDGPWVHGVRKEHHEGPAPSGGDPLPGPLAPQRRQARRRQLAEEAHILYVALTRARDRLYVLGGLNDRQSTEQTEKSYLGWLAQADAADAESGVRWRDPDDFWRDPLGTSGVADAESADAESADAESADAESADAVPAEAVAPDPAAVQVRARTAADRLVAWSPPPLRPRFQTVQPSQLDDDHGPVNPPASDPGPQAEPTIALTPRRRDNPATRRGTRVHAWLERACLRGDLPPPPPDPELRAAWDEARAVWSDPALDWVFRPQAGGGRGLSEVPILHRLTGDGLEQRRQGLIDRLVLRPGEVDIVDYKTNRIGPEQLDATAAGYRPQLLAYRDALAALYPDHTLRCWLLWTAPDLAGRRLTEVR